MPVNLASSSLRINQNASSDGSVLSRKISRTALAQYLVSDDILWRIFPHGVTHIFYNPFQLTRSNLDRILEFTNLAVETVSLNEQAGEHDRVLSLSLGSYRHCASGLLCCVDYYGVHKAEVIARHAMLHMGEAKRFQTTGKTRLMLGLPLEVSPQQVADTIHKWLGENVDIMSLKYVPIHVVSSPISRSLL